ncbi:fasciclin domain-containing protein [Fibrella sp. HMF5335]|uniref:Fasciclin domain-containing protein n=1 Tax=Fibrella rubiginis TaxID=2817060 RepID=A0A939GIB3_9BACT|nr:fasciclin domain-containing protein [Fibrella rubiginis]MBO0936993.1 fasciclin domain-containing protein [Fibrella rubiginis]
MKINALIYSSLLVGLVLAGCNKQEPFGSPSPTPGTKSLVEIVTSDKNFSRLAQAVTRANLTQALSGANLTLFAPNNAAFAAAGIDSAAIAKMDPAVLGGVLRYHVLSTVVRSADVPVGINRETATLNGTAYVSKFDFGQPAVAVNGVRVTLPDIGATNGVMHIIDNVLVPATGTIVDAVKGNPNFTFLLAAVTRANLAGALSGAGPLTVFAPTDDAFKTTTPYKTLADINAATPAALAAILQYHVTQGRVFSTNFVPEAYPVSGGIVVSSDAKKPGKIPTLGGKAIDVSGDLRLTGLGNGTDAATITRANILTTNGVVHVIDRVLLPGS